MHMDSKEKNKRAKANAWKNVKFVASFKHAFNGVKTIIKEEHNMKRHVGLGIIPLLLGWYFNIALWEWVMVITCIFLVIIMEFINTIFETVVDMVTNYEFHPLAKKAKDIAAAAVLVTASFTAIIAALIFIPKIITRFL